MSVLISPGQRYLLHIGQFDSISSIFFIGSWKAGILQCGHEQISQILMCLFNQSLQRYWVLLSRCDTERHVTHAVRTCELIFVERIVAEWAFSKITFGFFLDWLSCNTFDLFLEFRENFVSVLWLAKHSSPSESSGFQPDLTSLENKSLTSKITVLTVVVRIEAACWGNQLRFSHTLLSMMVAVKLSSIFIKRLTLGLMASKNTLRSSKSG